MDTKNIEMIQHLNTGRNITAMIQPKNTSYHSISSKTISNEKIKMTPVGK
jgi:hypothetical protein